MKETRPIEEIINELEVKVSHAARMLRELVPEDNHGLIEILQSTSWSVGALRVVAKAGDQAQALLEVRTK